MAKAGIFAESDFSTGTDGWMVRDGLWETEPLWMPATPGFPSGSVFHIPSAERPSETAYFSAPAKFLGNLQTCYGQSFSWLLLLELAHSPTPEEFRNGGDLIVIGADDALSFTAEVKDIFNTPESSDIQNISVTLDETAPCTLRSTGLAPDAEQVRNVLADVKALLIRIDYYPSVPNRTSFLGEPVLGKAALHQVLQDLYDRLDAARVASPTGAVSLDADTLGSAGTAVLEVLPEAFGTAEARFSGKGLKLTADMDAQTVTLEGFCADAALCLDCPHLRALFTADADDMLVMEMSVAAGDGWNLADSFPLLMRGYLSDVRFLPETDPPPCLILSSVTTCGSASGAGLSAGLNVQGDVHLGKWPFDALGHLIAGLGQSMETKGPAICMHAESGSLESFVISVPLPEFSLPPTILPALNFTHNRLAFCGRYEMRDEKAQLLQYQACDLCAEGDVVLNGIPLPLAVYLPLPGAGWGVGIIRGRTVPIGDLAGFLGGFIGISLVDALPEAVQVLSVFELKTFTVRLTEDLANFSSLDCAFGTIPVDIHDSVWSIIDGVIELHNLDFSISVLHDKGGKLRTHGFIQGSVNLGDSLNVGASVPLPIGTGVWTFSARSTQPINALDALGALFGNNSLSQSLPAGLGSLASYFLQDLTFIFDPASCALTRVHLAISSAEAWHIVSNQLVVESLFLDLTVDNPMSMGISPYGVVGCALKVGSLSISAEVGCSYAGSPWMLRVSAAPVPLPTLGDMTALLAGQSVADALPDTLANNGFSLFGLEIQADLSAIRVEKIALGLVTLEPWTVIGNDILVVQNVEVYFSFDWGKPTDSLAITGYISGIVTFIGSDFILSADKRAAGWDLTAELDSTTPFSLRNVVTTFGGEELWQYVATLGVPNVSLSEGRITYATDTGNYSLKGVVDFTDPAADIPWTINIGITTLTIRSLGVGIAAQYNENGQVQNQQIHVTGAFDIGSVQFNVSYDTSKGVVVDCTLVADDQPVSASEIATALLGAEVVSNVTYTAGVIPLDQIIFSGVHAQLVVGVGSATSSFKLYGTVCIEDVAVNAVLEVRHSSSAGWGLIVGIKVDTTWTLPGFTDTLESFKFDKQTWMIAATSFTDPSYAFPDSFTMPAYRGVYKYLDFYASFSTGDTDPAVAGVDQLLPTKQLSPSLTVMGVIADNLSKSWLKCMLYADENGVPIFGWDSMRLINVSFVITGEPAVALQAAFLYKGIYNIDPVTGEKNYFQLQLSAGVTPAHAFIIASGTDGKPIFNWENALGLTGFTLQLDWVRLGLVFAELGIEGGFQGLVRFCNPPRESAAITALRNALPDPEHVAAVLARLRKNRDLWLRTEGSVSSPPIPGVPKDITAFCLEQQPAPEERIYSRGYDPNEILVKLLAVIAVTPASEGIPIPQEMGGHIVNVTIPYLLNQFVDIDVPDIIQPIQLPDVCFYIRIGPNANGFEFYFHGIIIIFSWHGEVEALFQLPHIKFIADMDPVLLGFSQDDPLIIVARSRNDPNNGPYFHVDSQPPAGTAMIRGNIYCSFLRIFNFETEIEVSGGPPPYIHFSSKQNLGALLDYSLEFTYRDLNYISASGGFTINLTDQQGASDIPGFSVAKNGETYRVADTIDLTKVKTGVFLSALTAFTLDAKTTSPQFKLQFSSSFLVKLGKECNITCYLNFTCDVKPDTLETMPVLIISQLGQNSFEVFGALIGTAQCFAFFIKEGLFILLEAAESARVLAGFFAVSVGTFVNLLDDIGNSLDDISDWLWDIFGSEDSESNTKAIRNNTDDKYSSDEVAEAVRDTQDKKDPDNPYTAQKLMKDQAGAGYKAAEAVSALKSVFPQYKPVNMAVEAGRLAADPGLTQYTPSEVAPALKVNYPSKAGTAQDMFGLLAQVYTGTASLSAQQMADALASSGYPAGDVAKVLHDNYPADVSTAASMADILYNAYRDISPALTGDDLASALAPFFDPPPVAGTVYDHFQATYADKPETMADTLLAAYSAAGRPLDTETMTVALAGCGYTAVLVAPVIRQRYPSVTATAESMACLMLRAYPGLQVGDMTSALVVCGYDTASIGEVLLKYYGTEVSTPQEMAVVLAGQGIPADQTAQTLKALFASVIPDASAMIVILNGAYGSPPLTVQQMAAALAAAPYAPFETAPALKTAYPEDTATPSLMATLLTTAYGKDAVTAAVMAQALAAVPYEATETADVLLDRYPGESDTVQKLAALLYDAPYPADANAGALRHAYPQDTEHAEQLASIFADAGYSVVTTSPVLTENYPAEVNTAGAMYEILTAAYTNPAPDASQMAAALAASPFEPCEAAPVLRAGYPQETTTAEDMCALLEDAYSPALDAGAMAAALAAALYPVTEVAPLLRIRYPSETGTANALTSLLTEAYPELPLNSCLSGLAAAAFSAYASATAMPAHYAPLPGADAFATGLSAAYATVAAPSGVQTGIALLAASYDATGQSQGIKAVQPDTAAGLMAAYLLALSNTLLTYALTEADSQLRTGASLESAATHIAAALPDVSGETLCVATNSAYSPPNQEAMELVRACAGAFPAPSAPSIATGILLAFPTLTPEQLLSTLTTGFASSGRSLSPDTAGIAVVTAYKTIGVTVEQSALVSLILAAYGDEVTPALLVDMLIAACGEAATMQSVVDALVNGYQELGVHLCAVLTAAAVQRGFSLTAKDAASIVTILGSSFALTRVPNDVAALGSAMSAGGFGLPDVSAAMKTFYGASWTIEAYQLLAGVYSQAVFQSAILVVLEGRKIQQSGADLRKQYADTTAPTMAHVLSSAYTMTATAIGVTPVAEALKAAGYNLVETTEAMKLQYVPDWTIEDYQKVSELFSQP